MNRPHFIAIGGPSCSGKSTLANGIVARLGSDHAACLSMDSYYRDLATLSADERERCNFDSPDAFDWPLLLEHVTRLSQGVSIDVPLYDFVTHLRKGYTYKLAPCKYVVVEGLLALHDEALRRLWDTAVYLELPADLCLCRRIERDVIERGRTKDSVRMQFEATVAPMMERFSVPTRRFAVVSLDGRAELEFNVDQVLRQVGKDHAVGRRRNTSPDV